MHETELDKLELTYSRRAVLRLEKSSKNPLTHCGSELQPSGAT